ncbi:MAG: 30S ribosomal protein S16 [Candidatus Marinimicrobia bacterium]|nr:30S ribosomal protein S16 [Candidatus Neomarinimicrobiota bacterium]MBT3575366.1 30S ribosomal protein S16 [Candidatus Neomarinimicrobiota bacterium]MBT3680719.1 30S ribosomal protein S16 [Candidatus Neomarinimicrobiota bacterium]MBT3950137.1 30S ribosomal protein S16 [Candidatus Neomarinimicrobiota bacterium]MBT4253797.1 30S ribosomal protein S16 [Candidatus Neomarinimicrobiota bacterium]
MAVKIRLKRMGKKKQPFYRIVVADSRAPRDGRSIEKIGHYNPIPDPAELVINEERLFHWMDQGAKPSDTVFSLLRGRGLTLKYELVSRNADEATISKEMHKWELARDDRGKKVAAAESAKLAAAEAAKQAEEDAAKKAEDAEAAAKKAEEAAKAAEQVEETEEAPEVVEEVAAEEETVEAPAEVVEEVAVEEEPVEEPAEGTEKQDS